MNRKSLVSLIVLNLALLGGLAITEFSAQPAHAQARRAGDYVMVAGSSLGRQENVLYITDLNNQALLSVTFTPKPRATGEFKPMAVRDMSPDLKVRTGR